MYYSLFAISLLLMMPQDSFKASQLKKARVKAAYDEKEKVIEGYFEKKRAFIQWVSSFYPGL